ncbi:MULTISPECIES: hypothetical protein [unclassified Streptomyces]|uniref:hypothetical protein n=1 Tax=unclassified Streptomyces TaxID=2593676 RepID=UPI00136E699D|nr:MULTISPECIES: hypothetical protein [unclassified Streptomyces]NDZ98498.1 hypothetical protein [Streptomyces sp. SID10116]MYY79775.1 hypothetical protein [Streptomyces sp. SID335]MYZ16521.1 hypothetical protein [Streptomyces sp. SID337]NDZ84488.1 hypothetical protein [Streptomyces sp. SID10115]NEB43451.1 hypothetical protein [Streptomyces sp. SID339]
MARIQILELPMVHVGDFSETPFLLIIDQVDDETAADIARWPDDIATRTGARHVLCFRETVDIPANDMPVDPDGYPDKFRIEPDFETFREQVHEEIAKAQAELARALRETGRLPDRTESTGRPTHPDGTPYRYHEIKAEGWGHCDGCRTWGQWTAEKPHDCINMQATSAAPDA